MALLIRNAGNAPALDIQLALRGRFDGERLFRHDALAPNGDLEVRDIQIVVAEFEIEMRYSHTGGVGFVDWRILRSVEDMPFRIVASVDRIVRRRLRDWGADFVQR